jgi:hypothetical protein
MSPFGNGLRQSLRTGRIRVPVPPGPPGPRQLEARPRPSRRCADLPRQENTCHLVRDAAHARTATGPSLSGPVGRLTLDGAPREPPLTGLAADEAFAYLGVRASLVCVIRSRQRQAASGSVAKRSRPPALLQRQHTSSLH